MENHDPYNHIEKVVLKTIKHQGIYKKYNLSRNPFLEYNKPMIGVFDHFFTGRKKEIENIVKHIVTELQTDKKDMAVVGSKGIGTRSLVNFIGNYFLTKVLQKNDLAPELQILKEVLAEVDNREVCFYGPEQRENLIKRMQSYSVGGKSALITSFFCDEHIFPLQKINRNNESTMETYSQMLNIDAKVMGEIVFLSAWHGYAFTQFYIKEPQLARKYEKVEILKPMPDQEIMELIKKRIIYCSIKDNIDVGLISKGSLEKIVNYSGGYPRFALEFAYRIIKKAVEDKEEKITEKYVEDFVKKWEETQNEYNFILFPFQKVQAAVKAIENERNQGKTLKKIIGIMIGLGGKEIVAANIAEKLKLTRPAMHKALGRIKIIEKYFKVQILKQITTEKDHRKRPYDLNPFFWAVFENEYVIPEVNRLLNNEKTKWIE